MPAPDLRTQVELMQPLPNYRGFTATTASASATTVYLEDGHSKFFKQGDLIRCTLLHRIYIVLY